MDYESDNIKDLIDDDDLVVTISMLRQIIKNKKTELERLGESYDQLDEDFDNMVEQRDNLRQALEEAKDLMSNNQAESEAERANWLGAFYIIDNALKGGE